MGRRPELKSDEFFGETLLVIEVISLLLLKPLKQVMQLLAARPGNNGALHRCVASPPLHLLPYLPSADGLRDSVSLDSRYAPCPIWALLYWLRVLADAVDGARTAHQYG